VSIDAGTRRRAICAARAGTQQQSCCMYSWTWVGSVHGSSWVGKLQLFRRLVFDSVENFVSAGLGCDSTSEIFLEQTGSVNSYIFILIDYSFSEWYMNCLLCYYVSTYPRDLWCLL